MGSRQQSSQLRQAAWDDSAHRWPLLPVLATLVACWALFAWPWLLGYVTIPWDAKAQFQPQIQFLAQSLARGDSPFWNPYVFAGHPQIADPQSMIFSPPFLALALVDAAPSLRAVDATVFAMILLGGAAVIVWFRDQGWHWAGGLIAALGFMFGAAMAWRVQHTGQVLSLAYWPIALVGLDRAMTRRSIGYGIASGVVAAAIVLGRDQVALIGLYLLAAYVLWRWLDDEAPRRAIGQTLAPLATATVVALALAIVPLVLTSLLAADSNRPMIDYEGAGRGSLHPALLLTAVIPQLFGASGHMADYWGPPSFAWDQTGLFIAQNMGQLYIGAVPLLLLAWAAATGRLWAREVRFFTVAAVVVLAYALGWYTPVFRVIYEVLPGVNLYRRPADAVFFVGALGAILAGHAGHLLFTTPWHGITQRHALMAASALGAAALVGLGLGLGLDRIGRVPAALATAAVSMLAGAVALAYAAPRIALQPWAAALAMALVTTLDLSANNGPSSSSALPPATYEAMQPDTRNETVRTLQRLVAAGQSDVRRDRVELLGLGFHWPNVSISQRLENTLGYNPVRLRAYSEVTGAGDTIGQAGERKFTALYPSYASPLADLLGLRWIAAGVPLEAVDPAAQAVAFPIVARTPEAIIYENPRALPRVLFATRAIDTGRHSQVDVVGLMQLGHSPGAAGVDFRTTVLLDRPARLPAPAKAFAAPDRRPGTARLVSVGNTEVIVDAASSDGGFVVLNDLWHPWWFADMDGRPAKIMRANVLFRAVEVPPGAHRVRFVFRPLAGAWAQLAGRNPRWFAAP